MKRLKNAIALLLCTVLLSGCQIISTGDDLLQTPKPSQEYTLLQNKLEQIMGTTMTYAAPQSGSYRNAVTFADIDGEDGKEAIAFLRDESGGKIYVYAFTKDGDAYQELGSVEGPGTAIGAMDFLRVKDGDRRLFTLTWTLASGVGKGLTVYSIQDGKLKELLDTTCTDYTIADLDQDGTEELFTLSYEGTGRKIAQVYSYADKQMSLLSQAYASQDAQTVANLQAGQLSPDGTQAVFVDNKIENDNGMQTDIYVLDQKNTTLRNLSQNSGTSTYRATTLYFCEDINGDAAIEVPQPSPDAQDAVHVTDNVLGEASSSDINSLMAWYQFDSSGQAQLALTTYKSPTEGWMFKLPTAWRRNVTISTNSGTGVNQTVFTPKGKTTPLLTIYVFTGDGRENKAKQQGLLDLGSTSDISYAAKLGSADSELALSKKQLEDAFGVIMNEWS